MALSKRYLFDARDRIDLFLCLLHVSGLFLAHGLPIIIPDIKAQPNLGLLNRRTTPFSLLLQVEIYYITDTRYLLRIKHTS